MVLRKFATCALFSWLVITTISYSQPGNRNLEMKAQVLDLLFPLDVAQNPYFLKIILRFGDFDTQVVIVVFPDKEKYWIKRCEVTSYAIEGMEKGELSNFISMMETENPGVKAIEIAARLKVNVNQFSIVPDEFFRVLDDLEKIRISPILASRIAVDNFSEYEFWYDNWQEFVHYTIVGPFKGDPQDKLVRWMLKFRDDLPKMTKVSLMK